MASKLIVLEGLDGAGTTTQSRLLASYLKERGLSVTLSAEPTKSNIGQEIRRLLALPIANDQEMLVALALCFAADRMQHVHTVIAPSLKRGDVVVLDRYVMSSMVYQGLHLPTAFVKEINRYTVKPDLTLVLDLDAELAYERLRIRSSARDFYETPKTLNKIKTRYLHFAEEDSKNTVLIDARSSVEQVHSHIVHVIAKRFFS